MGKKIASVLLLLLISGCTTIQEIKRPNGETDYLIACNADSGWNVCYKTANEVCATGYNTISEEVGLHRKELRISCPKPHKKSE